MAVEAWRSRCELYMRIYPYTQSSSLFVYPSPFLVRAPARPPARATLVFLALLYIHRPPFIQADTASCLLNLLALARRNVSFKAIITRSVKTRRTSDTRRRSSSFARPSALPRSYSSPFIIPDVAVRTYTEKPT